MALRVRGSHPLWLGFPTDSAEPELGNFLDSRSPVPVLHLPPYHNADWLGMIEVWAAPRSLATTRGMISFPAGTEMFQFSAFPSAGLCVQPGMTVVRTAGLPHSDIRES